ncbi:MAG: hypothetical protein OHK0040_01200 [bacterium]
MFYIFFALTVLLSLFLVWIGANLYAIFYLTHRAEVIIGRILVLLQKKHGLINRFMNEIVIIDENQKKAAFEVREMERLIEGEKALGRQIILEDGVDLKLSLIAEALSEKSLGYQTLTEIKKTATEIAEEKERYNRIVAKLEGLYKKKVIKNLITAFHIKTLEKM